MPPSMTDTKHSVSESPLTPLQRERAAVETRVQMALSLLRQALFAPPPVGCGWTYEALEQHTGKGKSYLHRVLSGVDKCSLTFLMSMPEEVRRRLNELAVERSGCMVVDASRVDGAMRIVAAYMIGASKHAMAKATLHEHMTAMDVAR